MQSLAGLKWKGVYVLQANDCTIATDGHAFKLEDYSLANQEWMLPKVFQIITGDETVGFRHRK